MLEWLAANWLPLLVFVVVMVGIAVFLIKKKGLRQAAIDAIVYAQKQMATEEGKVKMQAAIDYIQQLVPLLAFVPDALLESFIQGVFDQIESALKLNTTQPTQPEQIEEPKVEEVKPEEVVEEVVIEEEKPEEIQG